MNSPDLNETNTFEEYRYPFEPYPTGWYFLRQSSELAPGEILPMKYFGRELILYRTESGQAVVADAFCPHMGAHLGYGGVVDGENIRCPFHAWQYSADGTCIDVPYKTSDRIPEACLSVWPVQESSGLIFTFYSGSGETPAWQLPERPEWGAAGWVGYEQYQWKVKVHVQEIVENIPDTAHFYYVHEVPTMPKATNTIDGHIYHQSLTNSVHGQDMEVLTHAAYGMGVAWIQAFIPLNYHLLVAATPIDRFYIDLRLLFLVNEGEQAEELSPTSQNTIDLVVENTSRDVHIWEHKTYIKRPPLVHGDGPIGALRQWARQFYTE